MRPVPHPRAPRVSPQFALALKLTSIGARFGLTASIALLVADVAGQLLPQHPALAFGLSGGTSALIAWKLLGRFFGSFGNRE